MTHLVSSLQLRQLQHPSLSPPCCCCSNSLQQFRTPYHVFDQLNTYHKTTIVNRRRWEGSEQMAWRFHRHQMIQQIADKLVRLTSCSHTLNQLHGYLSATWRGLLDCSLNTGRLDKKLCALCQVLQAKWREDGVMPCGLQMLVHNWECRSRRSKFRVNNACQAVILSVCTAHSLWYVQHGLPAVQ